MVECSVSCFTPKCFAMKKFYYTIIFVFILLFGFLESSAQTINDNGQQSTVLANGTYQDFVIPNNPQIVKISFFLRGADGGAAILHMGQYIPVPFSDDIWLEIGSYAAGGGAGATVSATFNVGSGTGEIPLGSTIRFVVGVKGETGTANINTVPDLGTGSEYGGGGGGTAILFRPPAAVANWAYNWHLLGVAGGGGGAYQGVVSGVAYLLDSDGGAGREGGNGGEGSGVFSGEGGSEGEGGHTGNDGAGGGGANTDGWASNSCIYPWEESNPSAGEGGYGGVLGGHGGTDEGCDNLFESSDGGFGFGGGGVGHLSGGGGGGYSGGGAGGVTGAGGGGGSNVNPYRESAQYAHGGSTEQPDDGFVRYQVTLNQPPVAQCQGNLTIYLDADGNATVDPSALGAGSTDPEGETLGFSLDKSSFTCEDLGDNTVTLTVVDPHGAISTCTATVTVVDNTPPTITSVTPSKPFLWPINHKMQQVSVEINSTDNCPGNCKITNVTSNEDGMITGDGNTNPDYVITGDNTVDLRAERSGNGTGRIYTIHVTCTDSSGNSSEATTTVVVAHNISAPGSGTAFKVGSTVNFSGTFWDVSGNKHTAQWLIDNKTTVKAAVTEPSGMKNGTVTGSYKFTSPGVYKLQMNVTDQKGAVTYVNTNGDLEAIVVIYDPNGGYTYGGGYFASPAGTLTSNPSATGDVSYGFQSNYYKGASNPKGETQLEFKAGDLEFNALNFEYLVVKGAKAQFKGLGKIIGGQSGIGFIMTVIDGQRDGSGVDKIRMKIYDKNNVYYDTQPGASDSADPITAVGNGSTIFIDSPNTNARLATDESLSKEETELQFDVIAYPNPSQSDFVLEIISKDNAPAEVRVISSAGHIIENLMSNDKTIRMGMEWQAGMYIVDVVQGRNRKTLKLIKY